MNGADKILTHPTALCTPFRCASKTSADMPFPLVQSMKPIDTACSFNGLLENYLVVCGRDTSLVEAQ